MKVVSLKFMELITICFPALPNGVIKNDDDDDRPYVITAFDE